MPTIATSRTSVEISDPLLRIGGRGVAARDGETYTSVNPADETTIIDIASAGAEDVDAAVSSARKAFEDGPWARMSGAERGQVLSRAAELIEQNAAKLSALETVEMGKLYQHTVDGDIPATSGVFRHFAGWADKITGQSTTLPDVGPQHRFGFTLRQPLGVVGAITPWNNPAVVAAWKVAPALAAGCTVVLKPAEDASLSTLLLAELLDKAGLPAGALNVVPGLGPRAGAALAAHPGLDKVTFTGSPRVGKHIQSLAGEKFRKITLELGGKSPQLVFPDADLEQSMFWIAMGNFYHQGQVCAAGTRVIVHESIADKVVDGLVAAAQSAVIGDPFDENSTQGTIVNERQLDNIMRYIDKGRSEGAELVTGGNRVDRPGFFVEPTVFRGTNDLTIAREEIFGPVATVITFRTTEEAIALANDTRYGLNAMIYSSNLATVHQVIPQLRVGMIWVNGWGVPDPSLPWGGREASGIGRELGRSGLDAFTEEKTVHLAF
ncbi:aldehyde dehydrogenase family protein [Rhodococcus erythropolis]|uniref:aldehyde dehydrogenase family protein n=1 Tax=Rhodococcus erythropolis TaxID=1833 RepID=UPI001E64854A|nr:MULTISPECIES: aldehyde dehydrogenase family protein [Rhodococcus erythropolis group]MCD2107905.1 aldehyde dehydrogenase family protein [Rhodococcus qingshengii]MCZ4527076.1 aldehyde dehydrogenase family protein [Rhodococcus erythropolis]